MDRRGFLGGILALGIAPAIVRVESLMAVRPIQIATLAEMVAVNNHVLTVGQITREALKILEVELTFTSSVDREYDSAFAPKIGSRISVRKPLRFVNEIAFDWSNNA